MTEKGEDSPTETNCVWKNLIHAHIHTHYTHTAAHAHKHSLTLGQQFCVGESSPYSVVSTLYIFLFRDIHGSLCNQEIFFMNITKYL